MNRWFPIFLFSAFYLAGLTSIANSRSFGRGMTELSQVLSGKDRERTAPGRPPSGRNRQIAGSLLSVLLGGKPWLMIPIKEPSYRVSTPKRVTRARRKRYVLRRKRWNRNHIRWSLDKKYLTEADEFIVRNTLHRAFNEWSYACNVVFEEMRHNEGSKPDLLIAFERGFHNDSYPFDGPDGIVAHAFYPRDGRLHFDAEEEWTLNQALGVNLYQTALHEIGHLLGLEHSSDPRAAMYASKRPYLPLFTLSDDDVRAARVLFPHQETRVLNSSTPTSATSEPNSASSTPSPTSSRRSPASSTPSSASSKPRPTSSTPSLASSTPSSASYTPSPTSSTPKPASSTPSPASSTPSHVSSKHIPTSSTPIPVSSTPSPVSSTPSHVYSTPSPASSTPRSMSSTPSPAPSTPALFNPTPILFNPTPKSSDLTPAFPEPVHMSSKAVVTFKMRSEASSKFVSTQLSTSLLYSPSSSTLMSASSVPTTLSSKFTSPHSGRSFMPLSIFARNSTTFPFNIRPSTIVSTIKPATSPSAENVFYTTRSSKRTGATGRLTIIEKYRRNRLRKQHKSRIRGFSMLTLSENGLLLTRPSFFSQQAQVIANSIVRRR